MQVGRVEARWDGMERGGGWGAWVGLGGTKWHPTSSAG